MAVPGSALRWAGLNLCLHGQPGLKRKLRSLVIGEGEGDRFGALPDAALPLLPAGWEAAAGRELERADRLGLRIVTLDDGDYPPLLRVAPDPPILLYMRGRLRPADALAIAVVGSRRATPYGIGMAHRLGAGLAAGGYAVVSGMARGIDAAAHRGALDAGGRTLAVLGCGLDRVYPAEHRELADRIAAAGAIISELPLGTAPLKQNFPGRNRLIAWISWATVVVEAARHSGSLITAALAAEGGRLVCAVPGPVGEEGSEGTNALLRDGAIVCRGADDLIDDLNPQVRDAARHAGRPDRPADTPADGGCNRGAAGESQGDGLPGPLSGEHRRLLAYLSEHRGTSIDALETASGMPSGALLTALLELEIGGLVRALPGRRFLKIGCNI